MKALIIYDSFFGNTERVAQAIATALSDRADVTARRVGDVRPEHLTGLDLLIVGSPTRVFYRNHAHRTQEIFGSNRRLQAVTVSTAHWYWTMHTNISYNASNAVVWRIWRNRSPRGPTVSRLLISSGL